jgi:hypothetical protein
MAILRPESRASYSTILFDAGKWRRTAYRMCSPRGETKSRPAPTPVFITEPSKYRVQHSAWICGGSNCVSVHSATKSAKIWDLMALRGAYESVSPINSTDHLAILPATSGFRMISPNGKEETTVTG